MHTFAHIELPTTSLARATEFYGSLFGWQFETFATDDYLLILAADGAVVGGLVLLSVLPQIEEYFNYVEVQSLAEMLARAEGLGGRMYRPPTELPAGFGHYAIIEAPDGYKLGLWARGA